MAYWKGEVHLDKKNVVSLKVTYDKRLEIFIQKLNSLVNN